MDITQVSILHHVGIVLLVLWLLAEFDWCHPLAYFLSLIYLYLVHERYIMRLRKKIQIEEKKQANQKRVLSDSETVRWLNHAVEKIWPICMEPIASQKILLPIIPWFLEKYKPWTAKKAVVQHLYLGRNPPIFTDMRVLRQSTDDDHLVMELGMNFLTADDFSAILAVKMRKRLGFGMWAKMHLTGMHVEGKILIGVKFLRDWPYLERLRVCFVEPPYFQMTVKPIFTHGLDVTELPGIAGWLDKLLSIAFKQTLVEPNMLVVDMKKFASPNPENWFSVDEREPVAFAKVEVVEASDMKPSDLNGLADPYVKGLIGTYRFKTKIQRKTLTPKWQEEFKIPIVTWESPNILTLEVRDKDHFVDDVLGDCSVNISDYRNGQRHDMWLPLRNIKTGRLRITVTVMEVNNNTKVDDEENVNDWESFNKEAKKDSFVTEAANKGSFSEKSRRVADNFEPIDFEGQKETGIWVHRPGSEVSQSWEPRKGKSRRLDTQILKGSIDGTTTNLNPSLLSSGSQNTNSSSTDENPGDDNENRPMGSVRRGLRKIGSVFQRSPKEGQSGSFAEDIVPSPPVNIKAVNGKEIGVKFLVDDNVTVPGIGSASGSGPMPISEKIPKDGDSSTGDSAGYGGGLESPVKGKMRDKAKNFFKSAEKSARNLKHAMSRKGSMRSANSKDEESPRSDEESLPPVRVEKIPVDSSDILSPDSLDHIVLETGEIETSVDGQNPTGKVRFQLIGTSGDVGGKNSVQSPKSKKLDEVDTEEQS